MREVTACILHDLTSLLSVAFTILADAIHRLVAMNLLIKVKLGY